MIDNKISKTPSDCNIITGKSYNNLCILLYTNYESVN